ncbi:uncharacterized protein PGRI_033000 [Penicillium griseofulvum]|uniref:Uncharacterized protein n=1 Tax=Penicillium patulum TaxID=5078 RepID=A0A135L9A8_PENPA|nr:uncharacterized protein PGRI_033000 [Penicillium griseofulvum]KXG45533.1 hypothetical protein PGRI_033000 [Penicillium griseofulvum]
MKDSTWCGVPDIARRLAEFKSILDSGLGDRNGACHVSWKSSLKLLIGGQYSEGGTEDYSDKDIGKLETLNVRLLLQQPTGDPL